MNSFKFQVDEMNIEEYASFVKAFQKKVCNATDKAIEQMFLADVYSSKEAFVFALRMI